MLTLNSETCTQIIQIGATINGGPIGTVNHGSLINRDLENQHPIGAITGLEDALQEMNTAIEILGKYIEDLGIVYVDNEIQLVIGDQPIGPSATIVSGEEAIDMIKDGVPVVDFNGDVPSDPSDENVDNVVEF